MVTLVVGIIRHPSGHAHIHSKGQTGLDVLYAFDLSPDLAEEGHFNLAKQGTVRVELKFGTAIPNTVTVVAYVEFENVIEIDRNRNIVYDFGS